VRVLIIEDDLKVAGAVRAGLVADGYDVVHSRTGEDGYFRATTEPFDAILLDLGLPGRNGLEILAGLRGRGLSIPVLVLTARDAVEDRVLGLDSGADDYLIKPFAFEVLLARLRALARRTSDVRPPVLQVADLALDPAMHGVTRAGEAVSLSTKEFALLHFLMRRAGQTVPRTVLIEAVWGYGASIESNTLDAFIHLLRGKIETAPGRKLIHTVRGVGYSLRELPPA